MKLSALDHFSLAVCAVALTVLLCASRDAALPSSPDAYDSYVGQWRGIITQDLGPSVRYFDMELAVAPDVVDSASYQISCHVMDGDYHAYMSGTGTILADGDFSIQEHEIVRADSIPGMAWCLKRLHLRKSIERGVLHLRGRWTGDTYFGACPPGEMDLIRNVNRT